MFKDLMSYKNGKRALMLFAIITICCCGALTSYVRYFDSNVFAALTIGFLVVLVCAAITQILVCSRLLKELKEQSNLNSKTEVDVSTSDKDDSPEAK